MIKSNVLRYVAIFCMFVIYAVIFSIILTIILYDEAFGYSVRDPIIFKPIEFQEAEVIMFSSTTVTTSSLTDTFYNVWNTCPTYLELHK